MKSVQEFYPSRKQCKECIRARRDARLMEVFESLKAWKMPIGAPKNFTKQNSWDIVRVGAIFGISPNSAKSYLTSLREQNKIGEVHVGTETFYYIKQI